MTLGAETENNDEMIILPLLLFHADPASYLVYLNALNLALDYRTARVTLHHGSATAGLNPHQNALTQPYRTTISLGGHRR